MSQAIQKKISDNLPEVINKGGIIKPFSEVNGQILSPRDVKHLPLAVLEKNLENVLERNKSEPFSVKRTHHDIKRFYECLNNFKESVERNSFTDAFENAFRMRMLIQNRDAFDVFVGDAELGFAMNAIAFRLTNGLFDLLEQLENSGQVKLTDTNRRFLD